MPLAVRLSVAVLALAVLLGAFAGLLAPHDYAAIYPGERLLPPAWAAEGDWRFPLGTDHIGRDVLSRLLYAIRMSLAVAVVGTAIGAVLGTVLGMIAADWRGIVEDALMALVDIQAALPFIIFALALLAFFGNSLWLFIALMGVAGWERYARLARGLVLDANTASYAEAIRAAGAGPARVYARDILPNIAGALMVQATINFPETILLETGLSFLGLGIQPPQTSLGLMLSEGRDFVAIAPWLIAAPGIAIVLTTLSMCLIGDWVRDRLDATLR